MVSAVVHEYATALDGGALAIIVPSKLRGCAAAQLV